MSTSGDTVENDCFDRLPLISTHPHPQHVHLFTISVKNQVRLTRKILGPYSWVFSVLNILNVLMISPNALNTPT